MHNGSTVLQGKLNPALIRIDLHTFHYITVFHQSCMTKKRTDDWRNWWIDETKRITAPNVLEFIWLIFTLFPAGTLCSRANLHLRPIILRRHIAVLKRLATLCPPHCRSQPGSSLPACSPVTQQIDRDSTRLHSTNFSRRSVFVLCTLYLQCQMFFSTEILTSNFCPHRASCQRHCLPAAVSLLRTSTSPALPRAFSGRPLLPYLVGKETKPSTMRVSVSARLIVTMYIQTENNIVAL